MMRKTYFTRSVYLTPNRTIARALNRPVRHNHADGRRYRIETGSLHPQQGWIAWIEETHSRTLHLTVNGETVFSGSIVADHPEAALDRLGYEIKYLNWLEDQLILIFSVSYSWRMDENWSHRTYFCGRIFTLAGLQMEVDLPMPPDLFFESQVIDHVLYIREFNQQDRLIRCYTLPTFDPLPSLSYEEAYSRDILINLDALRPMQHVHLREFLLTGFFGDITVGMHRTDLERLAGLPTAWGTESQLYRAGIWKYGSAEFHFNEHSLIFLIYSDDLAPLAGGNYLEIDPWELQADVTLAHMQALLDAATITYQSLSDPRSCIEYLVFASGVKLGFWQRPDENIYRLFSYSLLWEGIL